MYIYVYRVVACPNFAHVQDAVAGRMPKWYQDEQKELHAGKGAHRSRGSPAEHEGPPAREFRIFMDL